MARRDLSKLIKKIITDKNGHRKTIYVRSSAPQKKRKEKSVDKEIVRLAKIGVSVTNKMTSEEMKERLAGIDVVDYFKKHKEILKNAGIKNQKMYLNFTDDHAVLDIYAEGAVISRSINYRYNSVSHDIFTLSEKLQGKDIGKKILKAEIEEYQKTGIEKVELFANSEIGGYAWAKYGFQPSDRYAISNELMNKMNEVKLDKEDESDLTSVIDYAKRTKGNKYFPINAIASYIGREGNKLGKMLLMGTSWDAVLDFSNKDQMKIFNAYTK